jgi:hypothetical protein
MRGRIVTCLMAALVSAGCGGMSAREYKSVEGRYRVMMPGTPKVEVKTIPTAVGPVVARIAVTEDWSRNARMVMYADYPPAMVHPGNQNAILDNFCQGWAPGAQMSILSKGPTSTSGHPGREMSFESVPNSKFGHLAGKTRVYIVGARLYQVFIAGPHGRLSADSMDGFLNSFALLEDGPGPPIPGTMPGMPTGPPPPVAFNPGHPSPPANMPPARPPARQASSLAFYDVPDPADAPIEPDFPGMGSTPPDRQSVGLGGMARSSSRGGKIRSFEWADADADMVGGFGDNAHGDGTRDHHFRLEIDLPPSSIVESLAISAGPGNRWQTQPSQEWWPIALFQHGRAVTRSYVAQVGLFDGPQTFDLYVNTGVGPRPGDAIKLDVQFSAGGGRGTLAAECQVPSTAPQPDALRRPAQGLVANPATPTAGPDGAPRNLRPPANPARTEAPSNGREPTTVPLVASPMAGGATIVGFHWLDRNDDRVGTSGRQIGPGGGKDEHFQLVLDLPAAAFIEQVNITGGGVLRWTTRPGRTWPVAVLANEQLKNRAQMLRVGAFSGRWNFDLYVESHETVQPQQPFGVEVVISSRGIKHTLTARCERK